MKFVSLPLLAICLAMVAECTGMRNNDINENHKVITKSVVQAPGYKRALSDEEMQPLYEKNLQDDLAFWTAQQQLRGSTLLSVADILKQMRAMLPSTHVGMFVIQDGEIYIFRTTGYFKYATKRMERMQSELRKLHEGGQKIPDTIMIFNSADEPICYKTQGCAVPVFTMIKRWQSASGPGSNSSTGNHLNATSEATDVEILVPNFIHSTKYKQFFFPWEHKIKTAFHRASLQRAMGVNSTRYRLAELSMRDNETAELLDVGIVSITSITKLNVTRLMKQYAAISQHARWQFLISTDGHTASSRVGYLLGINSVTMKEKSPWIEYYYRSLVNGQEYIEFTLDTILTLLRDFRDHAEPGMLKEISTSGQQFAYRYLHPTAMSLYVRQAVIQYNKLFKGMTNVKRLKLPKRKSHNHPFSRGGLIRVLQDFEEQLKMLEF